MINFPSGLFSTPRTEYSQSNAVTDLPRSTKSGKPNSGFFGEKVYRNDPLVTRNRPSFGYVSEGRSFDDKLENLVNNYKESYGYDIRTKKDMDVFIRDNEFMEQYRRDLTEDIIDDFIRTTSDENGMEDPHIRSICENVDNLFDAKVNFFKESFTDYLPVSPLEFPVLVKEYYTNPLNDIIDVETTKVPSFRKQVRTSYVVDNITGKEWEYPRCFFDRAQWAEIMGAGTGLPLKDTVVTLPQKDYDIITELTDGIPKQDMLTYNIHISAIVVGGTTVELLDNHRVFLDYSTGGTIINGVFDFTDPKTGTVVNDVVAGTVNFNKGTISIASCAGQVTGVVLSGNLSNMLNLRTVRPRERLEVKQIDVIDGLRMNMPFFIEEIEDLAAMLDFNYYNRMINQMVKIMGMDEVMHVISFLDDEYVRFNGVAPDPSTLRSFAITSVANVLPPTGVMVPDPFTYKTHAVQFAIESMMEEIANMAKIEGLAFVIVGNPMATRLLSEWTTWKYQNGTNIGGIKVNRSYGFMTGLGGPVRVVASNLFSAWTDEPVNATTGLPDPTGKRELVLRIYAYPTDAEHITYKHVKYTSHLMNTPNTAYGSINAPAGAYAIVTATNRYATFAITGIQGRLIIANSDSIGYQPAPVVVTP